MKQVAPGVESVKHAQTENVQRVRSLLLYSVSQETRIERTVEADLRAIALVDGAVIACKSTESTAIVTDNSASKAAPSSV